MVRIAVATANSLKVAAVRASFERCFPHSLIRVHALAADSHINAQPVGYDETRTGARNRLAGVREAVRNGREKCDFLVAVENGIVELAGKWFDFAWVLVEDDDGVVFEAVSGAIPFPSELVAQAKEKGFESTTVGDMIAATYPEANSKDPHETLTCELLTRVDFLKQAVSNCIGQIRFVTHQSGQVDRDHNGRHY